MPEQSSVALVTVIKTTTTMSNNANRESTPLQSVNVQANHGRHEYTIVNRKEINVDEVETFFQEELQECRAWTKTDKVNNMEKLIDRKCIL